MKLSAFYTSKLFARLSIKERTLFIKRLSFLIRAGVPILQGLRMLGRYRSQAKSLIFENIILGVENGQCLSDSMEKYRYIFGSFIINIIRVGESSGILDQNLDYLAEELKKKQELRRKIISALVYPVFIIIATLGIVALLLAFVFPKVLPIFASLNMDLPITTRLLIIISGFALKYGLYALAGLILLIIGFLILIKKYEPAKFVVSNIILKLPVVGKMTLSYQLTNFCRTLGLLLKSGIKMSQAITITADATPNLIYKTELEKLSKSVLKGKRISYQLTEKPRLFPEIVTQMIMIGEHSGNLDDTLIYLAEMYENEVDEQTKNLSSALEPILMVTMGLIVGFIAVSIITPIYQVTQNLSPR